MEPVPRPGRWQRSPFFHPPHSTGGIVMRAMRIRRATVGLALVCGGLLGRPAGTLPRAAAAEPAALSPCAPPLTAHRLVRMGRCELDQVYLQAGVGEVPWGVTRGRVIYKPGSRCSVALGRAASLAWQGKVLRPEDHTMINRVFGFRAIAADIYYGDSWMDGRPAIILDYAGR